MLLLNKAANSRSPIRICGAEGSCVFVVGGHICRLSPDVLEIRGTESRFIFLGLNEAEFEYTEPRELPESLRDSSDLVDFTFRIIDRTKDFFFLAVLKNSESG
ncbi:MAG: hypothetical protein WCE61_07805 [Candidatus Acidiferrum sp.]